MFGSMVQNGIVGRGDAGLGQRVEKGRLADVRQADDAAFDAHGCSSESLGVCRRFIASFKSPATASGSTPMRVVDRAQHRRLVVLARPAQHPGGDAVLVAGMADADAQPVEPAVPQHAA